MFFNTLTHFKDQIKDLKITHPHMVGTSQSPCATLHWIWMTSTCRVQWKGGYRRPPQNVFFSSILECLLWSVPAHYTAEGLKL